MTRCGRTEWDVIVNCDVIQEVSSMEMTVSSMDTDWAQAAIDSR